MLGSPSKWQAWALQLMGISNSGKDVSWWQRQQMPHGRINCTIRNATWVGAWNATRASWTHYADPRILRDMPHAPSRLGYGQNVRGHLQVVIEGNVFLLSICNSWQKLKEHKQNMRRYNRINRSIDINRSHLSTCKILRPFSPVCHV